MSHLVNCKTQDNMKKLKQAKIVLFWRMKNKKPIYNYKTTQHPSFKQSRLKVKVQRLILPPILAIHTLKQLITTSTHCNLKRTRRRVPSFTEYTPQLQLHATSNIHELQ